MTDGRPLVRVRVAFVFALVLAGCGGDTVPAAAPGTAPGAATASADAPAPARDDGPASCNALSLAEGTAIAGGDLAQCMVDYFAFAGSGASEMRSATASSRMVWRMADEYEAYAELDSGMRMSMVGGAAWIDLGNTGWRRADPPEPGMEMASRIVQAWREASAPELARRMIEAAPEWEVVPSRAVDLPDGTSRTLAGVRAAAPFQWAGATVDAMTFWMDAPGRTILQEATVTAAGMTATSTTHYTRWGGEVDIPDPAAE